MNLRRGARHYNLTDSEPSIQLTSAMSEDEKKADNMEEDPPGLEFDAKKKSESVKFLEPLNEVEELEKQYENLMESSKSTDDQLTNTADESWAPELVDALEEASASSHHDATTTNPTDSPGSKANLTPPATTTDEESTQSKPVLVSQEIAEEVDKKSEGRSGGSFDITPEDIFNEIAVAHGESTAEEKGQNIHSFIISKTFSSENVVVLLNLHRLPDGEWVLDKTIAQGLKPETYGGVVSIDQYEFADQPPGQSSKPALPNQMVRSMENVGENDKSITDILKKLEEHVQDANQEINQVRNLLKKRPPCSPCTSTEADKTFEGPNTPFDELPFVEKLKKILDNLLSIDNEPCECCNDDISAYKEITLWLRSVMTDIAEFAPFSFFAPGVPGSMNAASAAALISQSVVLLEQARQSGLLSEIMKSPQNSNDLVGMNKDENAIGSNNEDDSVLLQKAEENTDIHGSLQLIIESKSDIEEFIREHENEQEKSET